MTLVIKKPASGKLVMAKTPGNGLDADAAAYIAAVEAADGQALEAGVRWNIDQFVRGCKADGIWTAIKASCILAGARTLNGSLVPLVGAAPTNNNFVAGDYNRKTGLLGNAVNKWLNTNRAASSEAFNNVHMAVFANTREDISGRYAGTAQLGDPRLELIGNSTNGFRARVNGAIYAHGTTPGVPCLIGVSRSSSSSYSWRFGGQSGSQADAAIAGHTVNYAIGAQINGAQAGGSRLAFYSVGEALDLALLDARVTTLLNSNASVIP